MSVYVSASDEGALARTREALSAGKIVVIPTDTVYGLAARVDDQQAIKNIFHVKGRSPKTPLPVLVASRAQAAGIGVFDDHGIALTSRFWPGALTIVVPRVETFTTDLGADDASVGLRAPDHPFCNDLLSESGPLAATSANASGGETGRTITEVARDLGEGVAVYVDGGVIAGRASTVVSLVEEPKLLREGAIAWSEIRQVLLG